MRNISRIPQLMELLEYYWLKVPDWRFGQLIENLKVFSGHEDLFYLEDDDFERVLEDFFFVMEHEKGKII